MGLERSQFWSQSQGDSSYNYKSPTLTLLRVITKPFESANWLIQGWSIKFKLSERLLTYTNKQSGKPHWHQDPLIAASWESVISTCFGSVKTYYKCFASLPMVGDRLTNEATGWRIQNRSIDGAVMSITFTLDRSGI